MEDTTNHSEKPVVAYYRLSAQKEASRELGIDAQEQIVKHYYGDIIVKEFKEIKSAKNIDDRPLLNEAIDFCLRNDYILVTARICRLSRNVDDCRQILNVLGSNLRSCDIPGVIDKFTLTLYAAFAERERELIALRTSQALQAKIRKQGKWQRSNPVFQSGKAAAIGRATNTRLSLENPNNRTAATVIQMKVKDGKNFREVADFLNQNGFKAAKGGAFTPCQAQRIFDRFEECSM